MRAPTIAALVIALLLVLSCLGGVVWLLASRGHATTPLAWVGSAAVRAEIGCASDGHASVDADTLGARAAALGLDVTVRVMDPRRIELTMRGIAGPEVVRGLLVPQRLAMTEVLDDSVSVEDASLPPGVQRRPVGGGAARGFFATGPSDLRPLTPLAPPGAMLVVGCQTYSGTPECEGVFVRVPAPLDNDDVESASVVLDELTGRPQVSIALTPAGATAFEALTRSLVRRRIAIVLDDRLVSAPMVMEPIAGGRAVLTMGESASPGALEAEAQALAVALDVGRPLGCAWEIATIEQPR